ncbi:unnamed protein product [Rotaria magnacalcarata]|uniref:Gag-like protein n=1 Tax=Rotaria magnacalcarata TaxID=392030 RepID=A0A819F4P7_9BILA|nr:unnamed protein product [Rotaria magnacalcarata]
MVINNSSQQASITQRNKYSPITIDFKSVHSKTDNIIERFGYKNVLLRFPRNASTLDDLLETGRWSDRIAGSNYVIKYPKILPATYSLIIHDFQSTSQENQAREGRLMNIVRADFISTQAVKQLLNQGEIEINCMELRIRPYFSPIKINKCRKCFKHDHFTSQCTNPQLCSQCGQHHPLKEWCNNELKCVNCQQHHYSAHSSCPVAQQKRKQLLRADKSTMCSTAS